MKLDKAIKIGKKCGATTYGEVYNLNVKALKALRGIQEVDDIAELHEEMEHFAKDYGVELLELFEMELDSPKRKMKRYLVFLFCDRHPAGGDKELHSMNDDLEAAIKEVSSNWRHIGYGTIQIWDTETYKKKQLRVDEDKYFDEEILEDLMKADWVGFDKWSDWG